MKLTEKVRLQLQGEVTSNSKPAHVYKNSFDCIRKTYHVEGIRGLQKGLTPAIFREGSKNMFRIGLFPYIIDLLDKETPTPAWKLFLAGSLSGAAGALACNPFELVKTRLQSSAQGELAKIGMQHNYKGVWVALKQIYQTNGYRGLYKGSAVSVFRSTLGSGANLACYSRIQQVMQDFGYKPSVFVDSCAGMGSGLAAVLLMNPVDVVRTRYYNGEFNSFRTCFMQLIRNEGPRALYKGLTNHFLRIGPHFALTFVVLGLMRRGVVDVMDKQTESKVFNAFDEEKKGYLTQKQTKNLLDWTLKQNGVETFKFEANETKKQDFSKLTLYARILIRKQKIQQLFNLMQQEGTVKIQEKNLEFDEFYKLIEKRFPNQIPTAKMIL